MEKLQDFQMFTNKEKIGMLQPDTWIIYSVYPTLKEKAIYKVMYESQLEVRPVGIIEHSILEKAYDDGLIELLGIKKFKKKNTNKNK